MVEVEERDGGKAEERGCCGGSDEACFFEPGLGGEERGEGRGGGRGGEEPKRRTGTGAEEGAASAMSSPLGAVIGGSGVDPAVSSVGSGDAKLCTATTSAAAAAAAVGKDEVKEIARASVGATSTRARGDDCGDLSTVFEEPAAKRGGGR